MWLSEFVKTVYQAAGTWGWKVPRNAARIFTKGSYTIKVPRMQRSITVDAGREKHWAFGKGNSYIWNSLTMLLTKPEGGG